MLNFVNNLSSSLILILRISIEKVLFLFFDSTVISF